MRDYIYYLSEDTDFTLVGKRYSKNNKAICFDDMEYKIPTPQPAYTTRSYIDPMEEISNDCY